MASIYSNDSIDRIDLPQYLRPSQLFVRLFVERKRALFYAGNYVKSSDHLGFVRTVSCVPVLKTRNADT